MIGMIVLHVRVVSDQSVTFMQLLVVGSLTGL